MTGLGKTAVADRVTALEMENTHLRRELFELRQRARLGGRADSWERLERDALKTVCDYFGEVCDSEWRCRQCPHFHEDRDCSLDMNGDIVRRAKRLAGVGR